MDHVGIFNRPWRHFAFAFAFDLGVSAGAPYAGFSVWDVSLLVLAPLWLWLWLWLWLLPLPLFLKCPRVPHPPVWRVGGNTVNAEALSAGVPDPSLGLG